MSQRWQTIVCAVAVILLFIGWVITRQIADTDLWGRLAMGALSVAKGSIPKTDPFSFPFYGKPWIDHEWLSGVLFFELMQYAGEAGLMLLKYGLIAATFAMVFVLHRKVYNVSPAWAFYALALAGQIAVFGYIASVRCQIFTFFLFTACLVLLESLRSQRIGSRHALWLIPILTLWANLHGGVVMGMLLIALYGAGQAAAEKSWLPALRYGGILAGCFAAISILNPYGINYWHFMIMALTMQRAHVGEWQPLALFSNADPDVQGLLLATVLILIFSFIFIKNPQKQKNITPALVLAMTVAMTLRAVRMQTFVPLALACYLPVLWPKISPVEKLVLRYRNVLENIIPAGTLVFGVAMLVFLGSFQNLLTTRIPDEHDLLDAFHYPVGAVHFLEHSGFRGNLMTPFPLGEFMLWNLYPAFKVSVDGRLEEVYSTEHYLRQYHFYKQNDPDAVTYAETLGADFVLADHAFPNADRFDKSPDWKVAYNDLWFTVWARAGKFSAKAAPATPAATGKDMTLGDFVNASSPARFQ